MTAPPATRLLTVEGLAVSFPTPDGPVRAVDGLSFTLDRGETLGVVGESGSGKSVASLALLGLLDGSANVSGTASFGGRDLLSMPASELRSIRGARIAMVFQDPFASLHPLIRIGDQLVEAIRAHERVPRRAARARAAELLASVGLARPSARLADYPHQLSGGMRQRVMIAMALAHRPEVLIADEPTTALDVTVQAQILALIDQLKHEYAMGVVLISHDLAVVAETAETVLVMYAGRAVERAPVDALFSSPLHPYTRGLLAASPDPERPGKLAPIVGNSPSGLGLPPGCAFHPRCPYRSEPCDSHVPVLLDRGGGHLAACHLDLAGRGPAPEVVT